MNPYTFNVTDTNATAKDTDYVYLNAISIADISVCVFVVIGNGFVLSLIHKRKLLGRSTNVFVFSIATSDFLNGIITIPAHILFLTNGTGSSIYLCKLYSFMLYLNKTIVPYTVVFMTIEKTIRILCPTREIIAVARCMFLTSLLWFFSASYNIWSVILFTSENVTLTGNSASGFSMLPRCTLGSRFYYLHDIFLTLDCIVLFITPTVIVSFLYIKLARKYFTVLRERILTYFYVIKLFVALYLTVVITHLPLEIFIFFETKVWHVSETSLIIYNALISFHFTRGMWNLIIYGYFKRYVCKKRHLASVRANNVINRSGSRGPSLRFRRPRPQVL